jgi:hypothetical protein
MQMKKPEDELLKLVAGQVMAEVGHARILCLTYSFDFT